MPDFSIKRIDDMEAIYGGGFRRARAELGVSSFGMQVIEMPPDADGYPEHDHGEDGQEEVYITLRGGGEMEIEGERHPMDPEHVIAVRAGTRRKVRPGADGIRIVVVGGVPGEAYRAPAISELGAPDPMAS